MLRERAQGGRSLCYRSEELVFYREADLGDCIEQCRAAGLMELQSRIVGQLCLTYPTPFSPLQWFIPNMSLGKKDLTCATRVLSSDSRVSGEGDCKSWHCLSSSCNFFAQRH
jgi:hypothetical protein